MALAKSSCFKWRDQSLYLSHADKEPDSVNVKLWNTQYRNEACVTRVVPELIEGSNQKQYTFIAKFMDGIPMDGSVSFTACLKDMRNDEIVDNLYIDVQKMVESGYIVDAYSSVGNGYDSSRIIVHVDNNLFYTTVELEGNFTYDYDESTVELSIIGSDFKLKRKFDRTPYVDTTVLFSAFNNCPIPIDCWIYDQPE